MIGNVAQPVLTPKEQWKKKYPSIITGILSFIQFVVTFVIIGCEVGSVLIDAIVATIYVGFWAGLFFMIAWITQAVAACCLRNFGCATYTLIMQFIATFFSICVIGFDSYYIVYPNTCFYPTSTCSSTGYTRGLFYSTSNFNNIKIPLIKAQLAAGCLMFVLCLVYIVIYSITVFRVYRSKKSPSIYPQAQLPAVSNGIITAPPPPPPVNYYGKTMPVVNYGNQTPIIVCPTCNTTMDMYTGKRVQM